MNWHLGSSQRPPLEYAMPHEFGHPVRHTLLVPDWFVSAPNRYSIGGIKPPQPSHGASPTWCDPPSL